MTNDQVKALPIGSQVWNKEAVGVIGGRPDPDCTMIAWNNGVTDFVYHDEVRGMCGIDPACLSVTQGRRGLFACVPVQGAPYIGASDKQRFEIPLATIGITPAYVATAVVHASSQREAQRMALGLDFDDLEWTDEAGRDEPWDELGDPQVVVAIQ